ncbi:MAG: nuclear transport factor 2 family protein [Myxococcales bacterium]|nr:nuclear transport factor 2 family protein [Myxococcales bacterium]
MSNNLPSPARLQWFYEELAARREGALEHIPQVFTEDVKFRDPFRETTTMAEFIRLFHRLFEQYRHVAFSGFEHTGTDEAYTLTYAMHLRMAVGPTFVTPMASVCRARDGRVHDLHDYFDFPTGLVSPVGLVHRLYRGVVRAVFL